MKPQLLKVSTGPAQSFSVRRDLVPYMNNKWHYHPEVELIHLKKGVGTQFVGDSIKSFRSGDIVLVGAHLAHYWRFDDVYLKNPSKASADVRVAHFSENFWGDQFLNLPENKPIKTLLESSRRGIQVNGKIKKHVADLLEEMVTSESNNRIILLMEALNLIANSNQTVKLSSIGFKQAYNETENIKINAIYEYTLENFRRKIQLEEIANVAVISPNSFCRYFKSKTGKTYSRFLTEIKVGHACRLLIENKLNIKQLCYESGFNNMASFHKYFKMNTGKSPLSYQKEFITQRAS
ncbi:AraC family transcriptional regulator [Pedobacter sp. HDW13]|uniref:AraC family transcriptional regulator n=1 Tax=Pedobacter sp. HDW13 TaxID=2714940 RepID=UPI00140C9140|nr:AraC family transcriptional regulator [Pedobacter sp. HDW13]QIL37880.1 AraC family transcriptional regulator [Pedobacter sp. HDW13]